MKRYDILAIGELLIDFTEERRGEDGYPVLAAHPGGSVANFLSAATKSGVSTALFSKVGDDAFGHLLAETVRDAGIDDAFLQITGDAFTTLAFVTRDANGEREFSFARKPGADILLSEDEFDISLYSRIRALHFGTVPMNRDPARSAHHAIVSRAKREGVLITFDPNLREVLWDDLSDARSQILWGLGMADIVKISDSEVDFLWNCTPEEGAERILQEYGCRLVFVTCGKEGAFYRNAAAAGRVPSLSGIRPVDTTGAGDIFGGTAIARVLRTGCDPGSLDGDALAEITAFACAAASISTERLGGLVSVPEEDEVLRRLSFQEH